MGKRKYTDE